MDLKLLKEAIKSAGGCRAIADRIGCSYQAVQKWANKGLPRTDFTGETKYAETICSMAKDRGHKYKPSDLRNATAEFRRSKAA